VRQPYGSEGVLGDLLKEEVRAAPLFIPLYNYYREYGGVYNLGAGPKWFVVVSDPVVGRRLYKCVCGATTKVFCGLDKFNPVYPELESAWFELESARFGDSTLAPVRW
jgi:hypothetical protein